MTVDYMKNIDCLIGMKDIPDKSIDIISQIFHMGLQEINGILQFRLMTYGGALTA